MPVETRTVDPNYKPPKAVQEAAARATELSERFAKGRVAITDINSGEVPIAPVKVEQAAPTPSSGATTTNQNNNQQNNNSQNNNSQNNNQPKTYSEQEFRSMQGRFERSQQEISNLSRRIGEMQQLVAFMQPPATSSNSGSGVKFDTPMTPAIQKLISEKEKSEYGEELIDVMKKAAREVYDPIINELRAENDQLKRGVGHIQTSTANSARANIYDELNKEVPDWRDYNEVDGAHYPQFMEWLNRIDPLSGNHRLALLQNAFQTGQASRVIAAFKGYKAEQAALSPAQDEGRRQGNGTESFGRNQNNANSGNSRSNPVTTPAVDLQALAAPGRARSGQVPSSPDKPMVRTSEIQQFYSDVNKGKWRGRDADKIQIEAQIFEAQRDGRIVRDT